MRKFIIGMGFIFSLFLGAIVMGAYMSNHIAYVVEAPCDTIIQPPIRSNEDHGIYHHTVDTPIIDTTNGNFTFKNVNGMLFSNINISDHNTWLCPTIDKGAQAFDKYMDYLNDTTPYKRRRGHPSITHPLPNVWYGDAGIIQDKFDPILEHSELERKVHDTTWDFHRDSIFNVEWYTLAQGNGDEIKVWRAGEWRNTEPPYNVLGSIKIKLVHTFKAPHVALYYKHIKESDWLCIREYYDLNGMPLAISYDYTNTFLFYKQYSSYTIHTL